MIVVAEHSCLSGYITKKAIGGYLSTIIGFVSTLPGHDKCGWWAYSVSPILAGVCSPALRRITKCSMSAFIVRNFDQSLVNKLLCCCCSVAALLIIIEIRNAQQKDALIRRSNCGTSDTFWRNEVLPCLRLDKISITLGLHLRSRRRRSLLGRLKSTENTWQATCWLFTAAVWSVSTHKNSHKSAEKQSGDKCWASTCHRHCATKVKGKVAWVQLYVHVDVPIKR